MVSANAIQPGQPELAKRQKGVISPGIVPNGETAALPKAKHHQHFNNDHFKHQVISWGKVLLL